MNERDSVFYMCESLSDLENEELLKFVFHLSNDLLSNLNLFTGYSRFFL